MKMPKYSQPQPHNSEPCTNTWILFAIRCRRHLPSMRREQMMDARKIFDRIPYTITADEAVENVPDADLY